ncbi:Zinc finger protein basonuclin-2 [Labeo rohita]|uniref:Zinc finger protein basonuclin-2 n=1 Tax=Labeo rohita TaxID=84645 RepID=A0ABQ8LF97_LABRO|nr:Zinc finger protein basonuclin-2 [Labeo rohita]
MKFDDPLDKLDRAQRDGAGLIASHLNVGQRKVASEGKWIKQVAKFDANETERGRFDAVPSYLNTTTFINSQRRCFGLFRCQRPDFRASRGLMPQTKERSRPISRSRSTVSLGVGGVWRFGERVMLIRTLYIHSGPNHPIRTSAGDSRYGPPGKEPRKPNRTSTDPSGDMGTWTHTLRQETDSDESLLKRDEQTTSLKMKEVVGCTHDDCLCECFLPGRAQIRSSVGKVCAPALVCSGQVEIVQSNVVFDISSLILYGTQAIPVRMKILLDRLFSVLTHTQVLNIIHTLGWTLRDYVRGYMLQDSMGKVLDRWVTMSPEDEVVTLRQFLRFGETKSIVELMAEEQQMCPETHHSPAFKPRDKAPVQTHHFENLPGGNLAFLQPFHYVSPSAFPPSPAVERHPATQKLQQLSKYNNTDEIKARNKKDAVPERLMRSTSSPKHLQNEEVGLAIAESPGTRERRNGASSSKARVSCSACAKTFYDKGTLKIHFNAVHLKIKHRCTVDGCNMMFSSLRSRNRHSANPNPRLHAAVEHATRRLVAQPRRPLLTLRETTSPVSIVTNNTVLTHHQIPVICEGGGGGATGHRTANQNAFDTAPKKKSRKSSTPLKLKRETRSEEHNRLSPGQPVNGLHGNQSHMHYNHKQFCKTPYGYHSNSHVEEIPEARDEWKGRCRPLPKVKEELCDPTCDCRGRYHSNL